MTQEKEKMQLEPKTFDRLGLSIPRDWINTSVISYAGTPVDGFRPNLVVTERIVPQGTTLRDFVAEQKAGIKKNDMPELTFVEEAEIKVSGGKGVRLGYHWTQTVQPSDGPPRSAPLRQDQYFQVKGDRALTVTLSCLQSTYEQVKPTFDAMIDGIKL